jgi:hypothetical protein
MPRGPRRGGSWRRFAWASGDRLMDRRGFGRAMGFGLLVGPFSAWAQQPGKVYRLGELREGPAPFRKALPL